MNHSPTGRERSTGDTDNDEPSEERAAPSVSDIVPDEESENGSPTREPLVVGIGASAGGLKALRAFFERVPEDSGLAFVVVVHLSPDHESHLAQLLQPHVRMPVEQVSDTTPLRPNAVYVIPPNRNLNTIDTHLRLSDLEERRIERAPIDHFFRTLARTHDGHAVGVVLTGTGSDGTLGLKEIKEKGGLTVVQDPTEAEYDGMPQSAVATGLIDLILPLTEIPAAIQRYAGVKPRIPVAVDEEDLESAERQILQKVFAQIRARTGRDFSRYKRSTILRRIRRRMQLRYVEEFSDYLGLLREEPHEVHDLADDLLITVTNFFRDEEVFEALQKEVIPQLFEGKQADDDLRVWSVGCATGEEAYSLAMLLLEESARRDTEHEPVPRLQIFASDLHEKSLARARDGFYPGDIATDVSPERLERFFHKEDGGYRIKKEVRELVVFAPHNLLGDPPFSRLDLVACRNVMIYLQRDVQQDVVELFHYALRPGGLLVLGTSETIDGSDFFQPEDKTHCIWRKRNVPAPEPRLPVFPLTRPRFPGVPGARDEHDGEPIAYGLLHQRMVERYAPPSVLVSADDKVVHFSEHAGRYLTHPGGEPTTSVFKLVREELRIELRAILHGAREQKEPKSTKPLPVRFDDQQRPVVLHARPALEPEQEGFILVIFDEREPTPQRAEPDAEAQTRDEAQAEVNQLEADLDLSRQRMQGIIEEYETSQEELKASNEELQSSNEELRSTLEELETSKEELQSMNEELQTVNQENRHKVEELAQLSSDLQNLMAATDIATLFLDRELRILRFTPRIGELFNVRPADRGRPLSDLTHRLGYDELQDDARRVLDKLIPVEREVRDEAGQWYLTRVLPYRSTQDRIEGVVITFIDITTRKEAEKDLLRSEGRLRALVEASSDVLYRMGPDWSEMRELIGGGILSDTDGPRRDWMEGYVPEDEQPRVLDAIQEAIRTKSPFELEHRVRRADGELGWVLSRSVPLLDADGEIAEWFGVATDITARKSAEESLRESEERYRLLVENATEYAIFMLDTDGRIVSWNKGAERIFGYSEDEVVGKSAVLTFTRADRESGVPDEEMMTAAREGQASDDRWHLRKGDERFWASGVMTSLRDENGALRGFAKVLRDNTERKETEEQLLWLNETLEARVRERTTQVRELASTLSMAEQDERRRIAQILHDDLQQLLFGIQLKMTFVRKDAETADLPTLAEHAAESERYLERAIQVSRELTVDLSPPVLSGEGLTQTLEWLTTQMAEVHHLTVEIDAEDAFVIPQEGMRVLLFQIVRELLFNVVKHADTDRATVALDKVNEGLIITVTDEGAGFDPSALKPKTEGGFGLFSVRERLRLFGGRLEIESAPGEGTRMTATIPSILASPTEE